MPSIIPSPGAAPATNRNTGFVLDGLHVVGAGETISYESSIFLFQGSGSAQLINDGAIWVRSSVGAAAVAGGVHSWGQFDNRGLAVSETVGGGYAHVVFSGSWAGSITNSGRMFSLSTGGNSLAVYSWSPGQVVVNSGLIAARSDIYAGGGVWLQNGGTIINEAGGEILAEGGIGTAVFLGYGGAMAGPPSVDVINAGRIEAVSLEAGSASMGIRLSSLGAREIVNSGTIKADIAILADSYALEPPQKVTEIVSNLAGGLIIGSIELQLGDDQVVNRGIIRGNLLMDEGNDLVDTEGGVIEGVAFMGWGDDAFLGGAGNDVVRGDRGSDRLSGGGGSDLLLGGQGDDRIEGGGGRDGLYGEYGDDILVLEGGDMAFGGEGNDRFELRDLSFAQIDGGSGFDRIVLANGPRGIDLGTVAAQGRIHSVESFETTGSQTIVLHAGNATALGAAGSLTFLTSQTDVIELVGAWQEQAAVSIDGAPFRKFTLGGETALIGGAGVVRTVESPSATNAGLDAVEGGPAAALPGTIDGANLADPITLATRLRLNGDLTIDAYETWQSEQGSPVLTSWDWDYVIVNHGRIVSANAGSAQAINTQNLWSIENRGLISATATNGGTAEAFYSGAWGKVFNFGRIEAISDSGFAAAVTQYESSVKNPVAFLNEGEIHARTAGPSRAVGTFLTYGGNAFNHGSIEAIGGDGTLGLYAGGDFDFLNTGTIRASIAPGSSGVSTGLLVAPPNLGALIENSGLIAGVRAIEAGGYGPTHLLNTGRIEGDIHFGQSRDTIENRGSLTGDVRLGAGDDLWLGDGGLHAGTLYGESGADILFGGANADEIDGGEGDDLIFGGGGGDRLSGGSGRDLFLYRGADESTAAASDRILGFETGVDRIDLRALGAVTISFTADGAFTILSAQGSSGTLTLRIEGAVNQSDLILAGSAPMVGTDGADLLVAPADDSLLEGGAGEDRLVGNVGNDRLDGGLDGDTMWGGDGDDFYIVDSYHDLPWEFSNQGTDTVQIGGALAVNAGTFWLPWHVENLIVTGNAMGIGNALDNLITGDDGNNVLRGGDGDDVLVGGRGADSLIGDAGADRYVYLSASDSTAEAMDRVILETGIDVVDLTALGPVGIRLDPTTIPGQVLHTLAIISTASGLMTIRFDDPIALSDFVYTPGPQSLSGTSGPDDVRGFDTNDSFYMHQGGNDRARGEGGNDGFYFGGALNSIDVVDGGEGVDSLALQGRYSGADDVLRNVVGVEVLVVLAGNDDRFGYLSGDSTGYALSSVDGNIAAGTTLTVQATGLRPGEDFSFDGSAETDGHFRIFAGQGLDSHRGGAGNDGFFFGADGNLTAADRVDGGAGSDSIALRGNYHGARALVFDNASFANVEALTFLSGHTNEFGGFIDLGGFDYDVTLADGNIDAGQRFDIIATTLRANESVRVDARAELDGSVRILSGAGDDSLFGSAGNDILYGGLGSDALDGSAGNDIYVYRGVGESTAAARDTIAFGSGDKIDLALIDAIAGTANSNEAFSFIGSAAFSGIAGQLRVVAEAGAWLVEGDIDGDGVADLVIAVDSAMLLTVGDFVL